MKIKFSFQPNKLGQIYVEWYIKTQILRYVSACSVGRKRYYPICTLCIGPSDPSMAAAAVNQRGKESRMSTVRRTRTELKRTTSVQLSRGSREAEICARPGLEGEVADLEVELEAVEERVSRLMNLIEEKMPLYKQVGCWDILWGWPPPTHTHNSRDRFRSWKSAFFGTFFSTSYSAFTTKSAF